MNQRHTYQHWRLEEDDNQLCWLYFDRKNSNVNTINREVMEELSHILTALSTDTTYKGLIILSAKESGFIAGADITQFGQFKDVEEGASLLKAGQAVLDQIENLPMPTVAMIDGFCLGGGMELALACRYRVAEDGPRTRLGLPEVKLGIHPGWGGSVRLPRLIGPMQAFGLILTGRMVNGKTAAKMGIVDCVVPKRHLKNAAAYYALNTIKPHRPSVWARLANVKPIRTVLAMVMRKQLRAKIDPLQYPAPFVVIDSWAYYGVYHQEAFLNEAEMCGRLFFSDTSRNLVRVFFLQERLKGLSKGTDVKFQHVHVIGAGTMGGDIAAWCAFQGMTVTLQDREPKYIAPAIKRAYALYKEKLKEPTLVQKVMDRLIPDVAGLGIKKADVIIEAIFEDLTTKQNLFKSLEIQAKPDAILATNTSSIPLDEINTVLAKPERLVGIHYFNPVSKMQLVEIVKGDKTDQSIVDKATAFVRKLDRLPLPVKSKPGFLVNRVLMPYLMEAMNILEEGVPAKVIDKAMLQFGMPMGPITLADTVGLDICLSVAKNLSQHFQKPVPQRLADMVGSGKLGRKSGEGFYRYTKKGEQIKKGKSSYNGSLTDISDRLVLRMLDEAFACLREKIVQDGDLLDAGMIFGTGFAPFRGGPIHYAESRGIRDLYDQYVRQCVARGERAKDLIAWG